MCKAPKCTLKSPSVAQLDSVPLHQQRLYAIPGATWLSRLVSRPDRLKELLSR